MTISSFVRLLALALLVLLYGPRAGAQTTAPQELARIWDAEHVSPPQPPLVDHAEVAVDSSPCICDHSSTPSGPLPART